MITDFELDFNSNIKGNWDGGELTSDGGVFLIHNFMNQINFSGILEKHFFIESDQAKRTFSNPKMLMQFIYLTVLGYHNQDHHNDLREEPAISSCFNEETLASQPTVSRFIARLDKSSLSQLKKINELLVEKYYEIKPPEYLIFDIDTSYFETYGKQEGGAYNTHYGHRGLSPLMIFDNETGLLIEADLREGSRYCCSGVEDILTEFLERYQSQFPSITRLLRGDSGFAAPDIYKSCETTDSKYVIRLKSNQVLQREAQAIFEEIFDEERFHEDQIVLGEFYYQAKSWDKKRRVVFEAKHHGGQLVPDFTYIVTNLETEKLELVLELYRKRGSMENFIKEAKNGFGVAKVSQKQLIANQNQMMIKMITYNLIQIFKALVLPEGMKSFQVETLRNKIFKIAAKKIRHARQIMFKFCSHFPLKKEFEMILKNIKFLVFDLSN